MLLHGINFSIAKKLLNSNKNVTQTSTYISLAISTVIDKNVVLITEIEHLQSLFRGQTEKEMLAEHAEEEDDEEEEEERRRMRDQHAAEERHVKMAQLNRWKV